MAQIKEPPRQGRFYFEYFSQEIVGPRESETAPDKTPRKSIALFPFRHLVNNGARIDARNSSNSSRVPVSHSFLRRVRRWIRAKFWRESLRQASPQPRCALAKSSLCLTYSVKDSLDRSTGLNYSRGTALLTNDAGKNSPFERRRSHARFFAFEARRKKKKKRGRGRKRLAPQMISETELFFRNSITHERHRKIRSTSLHSASLRVASSRNTVTAVQYKIIRSSWPIS